ncbi:Hsp70 family protein [Dietzia psychralcaliphila]|uniref:Hsp70 family protein n=1 Tax=Dietzia psychralcaliphila TaxID=139021 RepID=UPI00265737BD|nr:Hsp70 family protein [Dietzia psychralcaliphila]
MGRAIGIDLGTTNSAVAIMGRSGKPEIVRNTAGEDVTPSVVYFDGDDVTVGSAALNLLVHEPDNVVTHVKRQIGNSSFLVLPESNDNEYRAEDVSALILASLVAGAEEILGEEITDVVVTVPAYFSDLHRSATRQAAELAGLNVLRLINEPTAAALSYGLEHDFTGTLLVYDLGGGTFDVTILDCRNGNFDVRASTGDRNLGGFDFNNELFAVVDAKFEAETGSRIPEDVIEHVMQGVENAKRTLSTSGKASVHVSAGAKTARLSVTIEEFEQRAADLLTRTEFLVEEALEAAGVTYEQLDKVILVGGSTRMPMVGRLVERISGQKPDRTVHPDQAVALGAAIIAEQAQADLGGSVPALPQGKSIELSDVISQGIGVLALDQTQRMSLSLVMPPQTTIPSQVSADSYATAVDNQQVVNLQIAVGDDDGAAADTVDLLGEAILKLAPNRPAGSPLRVVFSADIDGIIHVQLVDLTDGTHLGEMEVRRPESMTPDQLEQSREIIAAARFT